MCDKELLVGYLYDELPPAERSALEAHLFACAECREELSALRATRVHLASWAPPEPDFGFQVVRAGAAAAGRRRFRIPPAWGVAAAAAIVLAAAAAIANLEVTLGGDGLVIRTGWARHTAPAAAVAQSNADGGQSAAAADPALRVDVPRLQARLSELETALAERDASPSTRAASASGPRRSDAEILREVRNIVAQSEARQKRELALQTMQLVKDWDFQRRTDLARVQQVLGRLEAYTGAEVAQQREMLNRFVRVSQGR